RLFAVAMVFLLFSLLSFGCGGVDGAHHSEHSDTTAIAAPEKVEGSVENLAEVDSAAESEGKNTEPNAHQSSEPKDSVAKQQQVETQPSDNPVEEKRGVTGEDEACGEITDARIKAGATLFVGKANCFTCHKANGAGSALGPDLTDKTWIHISGDYSSIIDNIRTGVKLPIEYPTPMPALGGAKLTDEEVCAVAAYVWSLSR
ncbi:MAG: cytochrome c, partial [Candidatus Kapaibacterium sp.]